MKYPCKLIQDLLPLYHDGVCSQESCEAIEDHFLRMSFFSQVAESGRSLRRLIGRYGNGFTSIQPNPSKHFGAKFVSGRSCTHNVKMNIHIHWAYTLALAARDAFACITFYPEHGILTHGFQEYGDRTYVFAEGLVIFEHECQSDSQCII